MLKPLGSKLEAMGFQKVTYTFETFIKERGGKEIVEETIVRRGKPITHGRFRNVTVVYDCVGEPWVRAIPLTADERKELGLSYLRINAYVPHVGDRGKYLKTRFAQQFIDVDIPASRNKPR